MKSDSDVVPDWLAKHILNELDDGIYVVDKELNIVAANETVAKWTKMNGHTDSITGMNVLEALPFLNELALSQLKEVLETSKPIRTEYVWPQEPNRIIAAQIIPLQSSDSSYQALTVARDLGEQKSIIDGIIKRELAARLLLEQATDGIHIYTTDGDIIYVNDALASRLGYTSDELLKMKPVDIESSANETQYHDIHQELQNKGHLIYETAFTAKDGLKLETEVNSNLVQYYGKTAVLSISRSISERRIASDNTEILIVRNELEKARRDLELHTSILQHDFRSDLQVVLTQVDIADLEPVVNKEGYNPLMVIQAAIERISKLLTMLSASTKSADQDLVSCLLSTASEARKLNPGLRIDIVSSTDSEPIQVSAGRLLPLVWTNLFRNAVNFAGPGARIQATISRDDRFVIVDILDNGPGVAESIKEHLFEKGSSTTGSGYGLYLCRKIVEAYGGTIELVNQEERGAQFRVTLLSA